MCAWANHCYEHVAKRCLEKHLVDLRRDTMRRKHRKMIRTLMRLRYEIIDDAITTVCVETIVEFFDAAIPCETTVTDITERLATLVVLICPDAIGDPTDPRGATAHAVKSCIHTCRGVLGIRETRRGYLRRRCNTAIFRTMLEKYMDVRRNERADLAADAETLRDVKDRYAAWSRFSSGVLTERRVFEWLRKHRARARSPGVSGNTRITGTPGRWKQIDRGISGRKRSAPHLRETNVANHRVSFTCCVCWEPAAVTLPCDHPLCESCDIRLNVFRHSRCPLCRKKIKT